MGSFESLTQWLVLADEEAYAFSKISDEEVTKYSGILSGIQSKFAKMHLILLRSVLMENQEL